MIHFPPRCPFAVAVLAFVAAACGRGAAAEGGASVRDSAGVRIVENAAPAWTEAQAWRVEAAPSLDIGAVEGEAAYQFDWIAGVVRLADGRVVVADGGGRQLRWFGASGRHLASAGRRGGGPGEFKNLAWIGTLPGDSVAAWDGAAGALTVFGPDGRLARRVTPAPLAPGAEVIGALADGTLVATPGLGARPRGAGATGFHRDTVAWLALSADGARARPLGRYPGPEMYGASADGLWMGVTPEWGRSVHFAAAPGGFYAGDDARYEIAFHDDRGRLLRRVRRAYTPVPVTARDAAPGGEKVSGVPAGMARSLARLQAAVARDLPRGQTFPAYGRPLVDPDGWLWVSEHRPPLQPASQWSVFDPAGRWMGIVQTPPGLYVRQVGPGWVLGTAADSLDVQHVRLHRIHKPAQGPEPR